MINNEFDADVMERYFEYRKDEGAFYWKELPPRCSRAYLGQRAGTSPRWGRQEGPQIKALGKRVRVSSMVWYMETGQWPQSYLYHLDGNSNNCHYSNLTRHNPAWGRGLKMNSKDVYISLMFKDGEWFVNKGGKLVGPHPDMGAAKATMDKILAEGDF